MLPEVWVEVRLPVRVFGFLAHLAEVEDIHDEKEREECESCGLFRCATSRSCPQSDLSPSYVHEGQLRIWARAKTWAPNRLP